VKDQVSHPYKTRMLFKPRFINIGYAVQWLTDDTASSVLTKKPYKGDKWQV
jgi:hypothetical protein